MTTDPTIREQTYQYFLQEAPELLHALEQGLLSLQNDCTINQVNNLMRTTHTLKGAASSVELTTITTVAHSLEDIFRSLCKPDVAIDAEIQALLFEGFECLRLPLIAELTGGTVDHAEILNRTAAIFAQLQDKLGDCFDQTAPLPTSAELGFDITQSIFETGVEQRLSQLAAALPNASPDEIMVMLRSQAEVFLGLAESLNLPGFGAIAQTAIAALNQHPDQVRPIAEAALADFRRGQAEVLAGDRTYGGQPSEFLQQLAERAVPAEVIPVAGESGLQQPELETASILLDSIWGGRTAAATSSAASQSTPVSSIEPTPAPVERDPLSRPVEPAISAATPLWQKEPVPPSAQVRVSVKHLDQLNVSVGELLTNQNRQSLQIEQLQTTAQTLLTRLKQHQQLLKQLQNTHANITAHSEIHSISHSISHSSKSAKPSKTKKRPSRKRAASNSSHLIQSLLTNTIQLTEVAEAVELFTRQAQQTLEQQRQLLSHNRDALIEARMLPLGEILNRFPGVLRQLETLHNKPIALELQGTDVLVDKVVAEKLYDPLLHLIRNAFDHGIEPISVRQQRGKPEKGQLQICAYNQGRNLVIEVRDDGKGIDIEQIRQRIVETRRITLEDANRYTSEQLIDFLFEPGFSTAPQVNDLSGRGIGLDVVRNQLQALQGTITVQSIPQQGTTFTLHIPLGLSIAQLLLCQAGSRTYAFLDDAVEQILIPQPSQIQRRSSGHVLQWTRDNTKRLVPIYSLAAALNYNSPLFHAAMLPSSSVVAPGLLKPVIVMRAPNASQDHFIGIEVDQLIGEQELVIRPLGSMMEAPSYIQGASVLADGQLALVIDGTMLIRTALEQQSDRLADSNWATPASSEDSRPPLHSGQSSLPPTPTAPTALLPPEAKSQARILVVEDSITTRQSLVLALQKAGYQVFQAQDGQDGIEQLQHLIGIELVICDIEMPRMNGLEFLRHCQQLPALAGIPIITLTSRNDEQYRSLAAQLGATAYMTKPYMEHKLLVMVNDLLKRTRISSNTP
ncbi:MAG: hybrid sensor histidine kinase/response regulator [Synechococcales cyanobacterium C42_A2020_086]|nr:hybrid sensor histidine kinase/response regulator [Synechococcales cyanobacterium C42_A2020_086]